MQYKYHPSRTLATNIVHIAVYLCCVALICIQGLDWTGLDWHETKERITKSAIANTVPTQDPELGIIDTNEALQLREEAYLHSI